METIILPQHKDEKDVEIISVGVSKIRLHELHLEFYRQAEVIRPDEDTGVLKPILFDEYSNIKAHSITSISYNYSEKGNYYSLEIYSGEFTIAIAYPVEQKEEGYKVANQIFKWSL